MSSSQLQRVTLSLPVEVLEALRRTAAERGVTLSAVVEELATREGRREQAPEHAELTAGRQAPFTEEEFAEMRKRIPWAGIVADGTLDLANLDEYLAEHWADDIARDRG